MHRYYRSPDFGREFLEYLRARYIAEVSSASAAVPALLHFYDALIRVGRQDGQPRGLATVSDRLLPDHVPCLAPDVDIVDIDYDIPGLLKSLREMCPPLDIAGKQVTLATRTRSRSRLEILQLPPVTARLLRLCDGVRTIRQIARLFRTSAEWQFGSLSSEQLCVEAFALFQKDRLVGFASPADATVPPALRELSRTALEPAGILGKE